ncbi:MAG: autotransporter domain-containing protein [Desulfobacteraceae bacterium]|nr:MAG: autotransporter domain-containing protein [Desulfobacteraceae bacterium]
MLRYRDVRFTLKESKALLLGRGPKSIARTIGAIHRYTQGWAAGMILMLESASIGSGDGSIRTAHSLHNADILSALVETGRAFETGAWVTEAFGSLEYISIREEGFRETGANGINLMVDPGRSEPDLVRRSEAGKILSGQAPGESLDGAGERRMAA